MNSVTSGEIVAPYRETLPPAASPAYGNSDEEMSPLSYTLKNRNKERLDRFPTRLLLPTGWQHQRRRLRDIFDGQKTGMERERERRRETRLKWTSGTDCD